MACQYEIALIPKIAGSSQFQRDITTKPIMITARVPEYLGERRQHLEHMAGRWVRTYRGHDRRRNLPGSRRGQGWRRYPVPAGYGSFDPPDCLNAIASSVFSKPVFFVTSSVSHLGFTRLEFEISAIYVSLYPEHRYTRTVPGMAYFVIISFPSSYTAHEMGETRSELNPMQYLAHSRNRLDDTDCYFKLPSLNSQK